MENKQMASSRRKDGGDIIQRLYGANMLSGFIFSKLNTQDIYTTTTVCKRWRELLSNSFIRSLYSPSPTVSAGAFLVTCKYKRRSINNKIRVEESTIVVDNLGRCWPIEGCRHVMSVTGNGLICTVQVSLYDKNTMHVGNLAVKRAQRFDYKGSILGNDFRGAHLSPQTCVFTYIEGHVHGNTKVVSVRLFDSSSNEWTSYSYSGMALFPKGNGVYSWGAFFWVDKHCNGVLCFRTREKDFRVISLPNVADETVKNGAWTWAWEVKGVEGNVVAIRVADMLSWKLRRVNGGEQYEWLPFDAGLGVVKEALEGGCRHHKVGCCQVNSCQVNSLGWWVVVYNCRDRGPRLAIVDDSKQRRHEVGQWELLSCLSLTELDVAEFKVEENIWPFEINNICWPRA